VETQEQLNLVRTLGVNEVQGFLLGRPTAKPIDDFLCDLAETFAPDQAKIKNAAVLSS
jgi:EAL domain-containing protein (putative c-di-GMP-specific phosphodiesterase class I)